MSSRSSSFAARRSSRSGLHPTEVLRVAGLRQLARQVGDGPGDEQGEEKAVDPKHGRIGPEATHPAPESPKKSAGTRSPVGRSGRTPLRGAGHVPHGPTAARARCPDRGKPQRLATSIANTKVSCRLDLSARMCTRSLPWLASLHRAHLEFALVDHLFVDLEPPLGIDGDDHRLVLLGLLLVLGASELHLE